MIFLVVAADVRNGFAPGITRHRTPPMGWRSWNKWECKITQDITNRTLETLITPHMLSNGSSTTLAALGYDHAGIDVRVVVFVKVAISFQNV